GGHCRVSSVRLFACRWKTMDAAKYQTLLKTADAFNRVLGEHFAKDGRVHPPTVVSASARMAGTLLFRSFSLDVAGAAAGTVVLSEQANKEVPNLGRLLQATL